MRALIVKTSSLGDVIHALPAVTDALRARPGLRFDWLVEEAFVEVPGWHPAVDAVIPVALRLRMVFLGRMPRSPFGRNRPLEACVCYSVMVFANGCRRFSSAMASVSSRFQSSGGWPRCSILRNTR